MIPHLIALLAFAIPFTIGAAIFYSFGLRTGRRAMEFRETHVLGPPGELKITAEGNQIVASFSNWEAKKFIIRLHVDDAIALANLIRNITMPKVDDATALAEAMAAGRSVSNK